MTGERVVSRRIPYVPISVSTRDGSVLFEAEALVDTGFDGHVVVPAGTMASVARLQHVDWILADGSSVTVPALLGELRVGSTRVPRVVISELGNDAIIGLAALRYFTLTLDHVRTLILEP